MIAFFAALLRLFLRSFRSKGNVLTENAVLKKETEILLRKLGKKRAQFNIYSKLHVHTRGSAVAKALRERIV